MNAPISERFGIKPRAREIEINVYCILIDAGIIVYGLYILALYLMVFGSCNE